MAENSKMGREPITMCTLKMDQCTRSWGDGVCRAGLANYLPKSSDLTDINFWTTSVFDSVAAQTDAGQFGGATFHAFTKLATSATSYIVHAAKVSQSPFETVWMSICYRLDNVSNFTISWFLTSGALAEITVNASNVVTATTNGIENATVQTIEQAGEPNWYRLQYSMPANTLADIANPFSIAVVPTNTAAQMVFYVYAPNASNQLDQSYVETTGTAIIPLSVEPCFNTRATCQDTDNYARGTLPLKFVKSRSPLPNDDYYLPALESISIGAGQLNPGGANKSSSPFGQRGTVSVSFKDFPHDDKLVDPYRDGRAYDPFTRGTFFTKLLARNPYYMHRLIEIDSGYLVDGEIVEAIKRTFVITSFDGVDSAGNVKVSGKDILTLAESSKAQAPQTSTGKLALDMTTGLASFDLVPAGIGNIEYAASGYVRIAKEIIAFTRVGDTITPTTRGALGTEDEPHEADSTVQMCLEYSAQLPVDILYDLLLNYANIPVSYLDKANWDVEGGAYLPRLYSTLITEPTGISQLVGEMCEQMFFSVWWDERVNLVKVRAVRAPQDDVIYNLNDDAHLVKDSVAWKDLPDQLVTQVSVYYGQVNPTLKLDEANNYSTVFTVLNAGASGANKYGINKIKTIFSRWIPSAAAGAAEDLATKIANRFGEIPKQVAFRVDAKDSYLWLGDFVRMQNRLMLDQFGLPRFADMQIFSANESDMGSQFKYIANEFFLAEPELGGAGSFEVPIAANLLNVNLRSLFDSQIGITLTGTETINFIVRSGVVIGGDTCGGGVNVAEGARDDSNDFYDGGTMLDSSAEVGLVPTLQKNDIAVVTTTAKGDIYRLYPGELSAKVRWDVIEHPISTALKTGSFPAGTTVNLIIESGANIVGEGGAGLAHMTLTTPGSATDFSIPAGDGGDALEITYPISITNNGVIGGGGGGGWGGLVFFGETKMAFVTGGGGAGALSKVRDRILVNLTHPHTDASVGTVDLGGEGGTARVYTLGQFRNYNMDGDLDKRGDGGNLAASGQLLSYKPGASAVEYDGIGGQPGAAIKSGKNNITWLLKGDVRGAENI